MLSRKINQWMNEGLIGRFHVPRVAVNVSHLMFADDLLILTNGAKNSVLNLKELMRQYEAASGQLINLMKSGFICSDKLSPRRRETIASVSGLSQKALPLTYLGVPLFYGRPLIRYFQPLLDKVKAKLSGWRSKL